MRCCSIILFFFIIVVAQAQPAHLRFKSYGFESGLSQSVVQKIHQCSNGYIWLATQDGLNRFDGAHFKVFKKEAPPYGLPWNNIKDVAEDPKSGQLWIATSVRGICVLNPATQAVRLVAKDSGQTLLSDNCNYLCLTDKQVWVATAKGLSIVNKASRRLVRNIDLDKKEISKVLQPHPGILWAFAKDGFLYVLEESGGRLLKRFSPRELFKQDTVEFWNADVFQNAIYISTRQGLYQAPAQQPLPDAPFVKVPILTNHNEDFTNNYVYSFFIDSKNNTWIGIDAVGLLLKRPGDNTFHVWQKDVTNPHALPDNFVRQIFEDRNGMMWFATEKGLARLVPQPLFLQTAGQEVDKWGDRLSRLFAVATIDDRYLFLGRISELWLYDSYTDSVSPVNNLWNLDPQRFYFIQPQGDNTFFAGCKNGLGIIEKQSTQYIFRKPEEYPELAAASYRLTAMAAVDADNFLLGGIGDAGLFWWNKKEHTLTRFVHTDDPASLVSNNITRMIRSASGHFWISTEKGLSRFDPQKKTFTNYTFKEKNQGEVPYINDLYKEGSYLWMVFYGQGLARWHTETGELTLFGTANGLGSEMVYNLRADAAGNFWLSTNAGLALFEKSKAHFINYTVADGVQDNEFNRFCVYETGRYLYFGGISGLTRVEKAAADLYKPYPPVTITQLKYLHESRYAEHKNLNGSVSLQHRQNDIMLQYAALDFFTNHRTRYAYMLQGYDTRWIDNGTATDVTYTNLKPGQYTFKVKAINPEFTGTPLIASLPIYIIPAWYQTLFFKVAVVLLFLSLLFYLIRLYYTARLRRQRREYEKLLAVQTERQRISSEIHDDIGAGLSGVRLLTELTRRKTDNPALQQEVDKIYSLVTDLTGKMREVIWSLNIENDTLESLLRYLQRQAIQLFEHSTITLSVTLPEVVPELTLTGEKRRHIYLAAKEALHNSLKHSGATNVQLTVAMQDGILKIAIADNGKGLNITAGNSGNGMHSMQQRMQHVGGKLLLQNGHGTVAEFIIPLS